MGSVVFTTLPDAMLSPYCYIVRCKDGSLYTGWTRRLATRLQQHNGIRSGGARYTASRRPVMLVWCRMCETDSEAKKLEARIKRMTRREKLAVVEGRMEP